MKLKGIISMACASVLATSIALAQATQSNSQTNVPNGYDSPKQDQNQAVAPKHKKNRKHRWHNQYLKTHHNQMKVKANAGQLIAPAGVGFDLHQVVMGL